MRKSRSGAKKPRKRENEMAGNLIPAKDLRSLGILQEVNRQWFHPLGLELQVGFDAEGKEWLHGVVDFRDDGVEPQFPDGLINQKRSKWVQDEQDRRAKQRLERLGFVVQPLSK